MTVFRTRPQTLTAAGLAAALFLTPAALAESVLSLDQVTLILGGGDFEADGSIDGSVEVSQFSGASGSASYTGLGVYDGFADLGIPAGTPVVVAPELRAESTASYTLVDDVFTLDLSARGTEVSNESSAGISEVMTDVDVFFSLSERTTVTLSNDRLVQAVNETGASAGSYTLYDARGRDIQRVTYEERFALAGEAVSTPTPLDTITAVLDADRFYRLNIITRAPVAVRGTPNAFFRSSNADTVRFAVTATPAGPPTPNPVPSPTAAAAGLVLGGLTLARRRRGRDG